MSDMSHNESMSVKFRQLDERCERRTEAIAENKRLITELKQEVKDNKRRIGKNEELHETLHMMSTNIEVIKTKTGSTSKEVSDIKSSIESLSDRQDEQEEKMNEPTKFDQFLNNIAIKVLYMAVGGGLAYYIFG